MDGKVEGSEVRPEEHGGQETDQVGPGGLAQDFELYLNNSREGTRMHLSLEKIALAASVCICVSSFVFTYLLIYFEDFIFK